MSSTRVEIRVEDTNTFELTQAPAHMNQDMLHLNANALDAEQHIDVSLNSLKDLDRLQVSAGLEVSARKSEALIENAQQESEDIGED